VKFVGGKRPGATEGKNVPPDAKSAKTAKKLHAKQERMRKTRLQGENAKKRGPSGGRASHFVSCKRRGIAERGRGEGGGGVRCAGMRS